MIKQVWDQNQGFKSGKYESNTAYKRFREFLELGPSRSVTAMAAAHDVTVQAMYQTSSKYNWKERAIAWDKEQKRLEREGKRMAKQKPPPAPISPPAPPPDPDGEAPGSAVEAEVVSGGIQPAEDSDGYAKGLDEFRKVYGRLGYKMALESYELFPTVKQLRQDIDRMMKLRMESTRQNDTATAMALSDIINKQIPQYARLCDSMASMADAGRKHWGDTLGINQILEEAYGKPPKKA